jgi:predicted dehydrogenase
VAVPESPLAKNPYLAEAEHFIDCVRGNRAPEIPPEEAYEALRISLACLDSARTGKAVRL